EQLVVIVQSEMGRTPTYNQGNGKDHWSIGSALFLGPKIKGNRVIGATDEKQFTIPVDPKTLKLDKEKGIRIRPEHVHQAVAEFAGSVDHGRAKKFPLGVAEKDALKGFGGYPQPAPPDVLLRRPRVNVPPPPLDDVELPRPRQRPQRRHQPGDKAVT